VRSGTLLGQTRYFSPTIWKRDSFTLAHACAQLAGLVLERCIKTMMLVLAG
jgi:hypothetical protein